MIAWRHWFGREEPQAVSALEGYALWAENYPPRPHNPLMAAEQGVMTPMLRELTPCRALDVGTGTGRYLSLLTEAGASAVGVDLSMAMLAHCGQESPRVCADAGRLPFASETFELVCSSLMLGDVAELGPWTEEVVRVLAPGGHLVYSDFHPSWSRRGWRRTFRTADGRAFELQCAPHAIEAHLEQLERHGLQVRTIREPRIDGSGDPVVVVFHAIRPGVRTRRPAPGGRH